MIINKDTIIKLLDNFPAEFESEDFSYSLYLLEKIMDSESALLAGQSLSNDDIKKVIEKW